MGNFKVKLDLSKMCGVQVVDVQGRKCVVIPVADNSIFLSQKGGIYLDLLAKENAEPKYGQTHFIKRSVSKKAFAELSQESKDNLKNIIGNLSPFEFENTYGTASNPVIPQPQQIVAPEPTKVVDVNDLPF